MKKKITFAFERLDQYSGISVCSSHLCHSLLIWSEEKEMVSVLFFFLSRENVDVIPNPQKIS